MKRLQIMVNEDMANKIDIYAEKMSVSKSALCCMFIGQGIMSFDKSFNLIEQIGLNLADSLAQDITKNPGQ